MCSHLVLVILHTTPLLLEKQHSFFNNIAFFMQVSELNSAMLPIFAANSFLSPPVQLQSQSALFLSFSFFLSHHPTPPSISLSFSLHAFLFAESSAPVTAPPGNGGAVLMSVSLQGGQQQQQDWEEKRAAAAAATGVTGNF